MAELGRQDLINALGQARADFVGSVGTGATTTVIPLVGLSLGSASLAGGYVLLDAGALGLGTPKTLAQITSNTATQVTLSAALPVAPAAGSDLWIYTQSTVNVATNENISQVGGATLPTGHSGNPDLPVTIDGSTVQVPTEHETTAQLMVDSTTSPLGANGTYTTSSAVPASGFRRLIGTVIGDQAGTLYVQQSPDGNNWDVQSVFNVAANAATGAGVGFSVEVVAPYARLYYQNGPTAQTVFRLYCWGVPEA